MKIKPSVLIVALSLMTVHQVTSELVCLHDEVQEKTSTVKIPVTDTNYFTRNGAREKRSRHINLYKQIRIKYFWDKFHKLIPAEEVDKLKNTIKRAIQFIQSFLYVIPVTKALLLQRTGCLKTWSEGPNSGKCALVERSYRAELCADTTKIPDSHLDALYIWSRNDTDSPARRLYEAGEGVSNADFVLYVSAVPSSACHSKSRNIVVANAGYCQLDQTDRPVAGYINFCPNSLLPGTLTQDKVYKTVLHELVHALGFSKKLFDKFRDCSSQGNQTFCPKRTSQAIQSVQGVHRLITPQVVQQAQNHFGCHSEEKYGGPLHVKNGLVTSHWNDRMMYSSLMASKIGLPHLTLIDPLTLAYFEDTGWYEVDYSKADAFFWGKGEGCSFGLEETCNNPSPFYCQGREFVSVTYQYLCNSACMHVVQTDLLACVFTGCHYLHKDKGQCKSVDRSLCHIVQPVPGENCGSLTNSSSTEDSRLCFLSNVTNSEKQVKSLEGNCHSYRCRFNQTLEVKVMESDWITCPFGEYVTIPNYFGVVKCPDHADVICPEAEVEHTTAIQTDTTSAVYTQSGDRSIYTLTTQRQISYCTVARPETCTVIIHLFLFIFIYHIY